MSKSIIIIGAGIAGLSAGCYGQMNGYRTQIFELHDKPGGLCTSWKRKGYTFDGCIHWLVGSGAGTSFNRIWQELGALQGKQIVDHEEFTRVEGLALSPSTLLGVDSAEEPALSPSTLLGVDSAEGTNGKAFIVYTDIDRLEQHMKELAPADAKVIEEFCKAARLFTRFGQATGDSAEPPGLLDRIKMGLKMLPFMPSLIKYGKIPVHDFGARFNDPFLQRAFTTVFDLPDFPVLFIMMTLAWMHSRDAGYPIGGSLEFARAIERRYLDLGGEVHYKARVEKILIETDPVDRTDRAMGVRLTDGSEHRADIVISAADGHATIFDMLEGKYVSDKVRGYYDELPIFQPIVQVSLGVARDLSDEPHSVNLPLSEPLTIAGEVRKRLGMKHYCYDPTLAPAGKSVVTVMFPSNHAYWKDLSQEPERYDAEKKDIAVKVIDQLDKRFPGFAGQVEAADVATPMTYERYTGNWQGSMEGWLPTTKTMGMTMGKGMDKTLPGLENFYMVGQWVEPGGGLPPAATSGRGVIQTICKQDSRKFVALVP